MKKFTLAALAIELGGSLEGDPGITVSGVAPLDTAGPEDVSFLSNSKYRHQLQDTRAACVIVSHGTDCDGINLIRVEDPYFGFAMAMDLFYSEPYEGSGISGSASLHPDAVIGDDPSIHPFVVLSRGVRIGSRVTLMPGAFIGQDVSIGDDTVIHPNVVLEKNVSVGNRVIVHACTVIGSDGFGFAKHGGLHRKILHAGTVRVEDDVEIGAGCTIDRAVMGETVIGRGSKLDNLIQIGHNVKIGPNCVIVAQAGVAGSAELEENVVMAGQSGVAGHLKVGSDAVVMGRASVFKEVPPGKHVAGTPAIDAKDWRKAAAVFARLDELRKKVAKLEKEVSMIQEGNREEE